MSAGPYVAAIRAMELRVLAEADLGYYQGDWVGLVKNEAYSFDGQDYAFIVVGYGSCSGCDDWEASGPAGRAEAIAKILSGAKWFSELDEAKAYIADQEARELSFYAHEDKWPAFVEDVQKASEW